LQSGIDIFVCAFNPHRQECLCHLLLAFKQNGEFNGPRSGPYFK
jgi:hypothetical protein